MPDLWFFAGLAMGISLAGFNAIFSTLGAIVIFLFIRRWSKA